MSPKYNVGDHVSWNSEAGRVSGKIIKVHTEGFDYKGTRITPRMMSSNMKLRAIKQII
jgi:hypothetical protein